MIKKQNQYIEDVKKVHLNNISVVDKYESAVKKLKHHCNICEYEWSAQPNNILNGTGCPKCSLSRSVREIVKHLQDDCGINKSDIVLEYYDDECRNPSTGRRLPFDILIKSKKILIEFDGEHHYFPYTRSKKDTKESTEKEYQQIQKRDQIKSYFCMKNEFKLIRIPYFKKDVYVKKGILKKIIVNQTKQAILLSGGLDSTTLLYYLVKHYTNKNIVAVSLNYGQILDIELEKAKATCKKLDIEHHVFDVSGAFAFLNSDSVPLLKRSKTKVPSNKKNDKNIPLTYVPNRNFIMLGILGAYCEARGDISSIYLGIQPHEEFDSYWDTTPAFLMNVNKGIDLSLSGLNIKAPFVEMSKTNILKLGLELGVDYKDTWTCYNPQTKNDKPVCCGICPSCSERLASFKKVGVVDPLEYV